MVEIKLFQFNRLESFGWRHAQEKYESAAEIGKKQ
jgi:hypothetical protein